MMLSGFSFTSNTNNSGKTAPKGYSFDGLRNVSTDDCICNVSINDPRRSLI